MSVQVKNPITGEWEQTTGDSTTIFTGATASADGTSGQVPVPHIGDEDKFLKGDGTWDDVPDPQTMTGATSSANGVGGLTPTPQAGDETKVLQGNGAWGKKLQIDIVESNGQYGYINGNNEFVPFKSQADIDAAVSAAMVGTATAAQVVKGYTFTNSSASGVTGTFEGQEKTVTSSRTAQTVSPDSGKYLSKVTVNALAPTGTFSTNTRGTAVDMGATSNYRYVNTNGVSNTNSGTYTFSTASTGASYDMGATNTYRYVNATNVYNKGKTDGIKSTFSTWYFQGELFDGVARTSYINCILPSSIIKAYFTKCKWEVANSTSGIDIPTKLIYRSLSSSNVEGTPSNMTQNVVYNITSALNDSYFQISGLFTGSTNYARIIIKLTFS